MFGVSRIILAMFFNISQNMREKHISVSKNDDPLDEHLYSRTPCMTAFVYNINCTLPYQKNWKAICYEV